MFEREAFIAATADILRRGYTLLTSDLDEIMPYYGWSPNPNAKQAGDIMMNHVTVAALAMEGVTLVIDKYGRSKIYRDGQLDLAETDIEKARLRIDTAQRKATERTAQTRIKKSGLSR
jgi:hypothetical protein